MFGKNLVAGGNAESGASVWSGSGLTTRNCGPAGSGSDGRPQVIVHRDANGQGPSKTFVEDTTCFVDYNFDGTTQNLNDNSRSVTVPANTRVQVFIDCWYGGSVQQFDGPGTFNISSISSSMKIFQKTEFINAATQGRYNTAIGDSLDCTQAHFPGSTATSFSGQNAPQWWWNWGDGTRSISPASGNTCDILLSYSHNGSPNFSGAWHWAQVAPQTEVIDFDWRYQGCHSWYQSAASAQVWAYGPGGLQTINLINTGSCGFDAVGHTSIQLYAGQTWGVTITGSHFDASYLLGGSFRMYNVQRSSAPGFVSDPNVGVNLWQPDLSVVSGVLGNWLAIPANPGGSWSGLQTIPNSWTEFHETAVIYPVTIPAGGSQVYANIGVDNGVMIWVDGVYKFGAVQPGALPAGYEYVVDLGFLTAGTHYIQFLREDHGGGAEWNMTITGWTTPQATQPAQQAVDTEGPADRLFSYYYGGTAPTSLGEQVISLSGSESIVDTGLVNYDMSGWFGGITNEDDFTTLSAIFRNGSGGVIASNVIGAVHPADRAGLTKLLQRTATGSVPVGTRSIVLSLIMTRNAGSANDGAADNLSFVLLPAPGASLSSNYTDPGKQDTHVTTVNWGDGTVPLGLRHPRLRDHRGLAQLQR